MAAHWFMCVFRLFHGCFKSTLRSFQECFNVILEYVTCVPGVFLGSFCPIEFVWVAAMASVCKVKQILDKNILKHPRNMMCIHLNPSGNTYKMALKHTPSICENPLKHPWNTNLKICISHGTMIVNYKKNCTFSTIPPLNCQAQPSPSSSSSSAGWLS